MEEVLGDIMFKVPSYPDIEKVVITSAFVKKEAAEPEIFINKNKKRSKRLNFLKKSEEKIS